jgi:hypothetical protein
MRELKERAEVLASTFNAQGVGNTLWAYATMARAPGAGLMRELEGQAQALAVTFNAQNVVNTLWAYARMGRESGDPGDEGAGEEGGGAGGIEDPPLAYKLLQKTTQRDRCPRRMVTNLLRAQTLGGCGVC